MNRLAIMILIIASAARAGPATTQSTTQPMSTPIGALRYSDQVLAHQGLDQALLLYQTADPSQEGVARAMAFDDVAVARFTETAAARFGKKAVESALLALNYLTDSQLDGATAKIEGERAYIFLGGYTAPIQLVRIDNLWKVSVAWMVQDKNTSELHEIRARIYHHADEVDRLTRRIEQKVIDSPRNLIEGAKAASEALNPAPNNNDSDDINPPAVR